MHDPVGGGGGKHTLVIIYIYNACASGHQPENLLTVPTVTQRTILAHTEGSFVMKTRVALTLFGPRICGDSLKLPFWLDSACLMQYIKGNKIWCR